MLFFAIFITKYTLMSMYYHRYRDHMYIYIVTLASLKALTIFTLVSSQRPSTKPTDHFLVVSKQLLLTQLRLDIAHMRVGLVS